MSLGKAVAIVQEGEVLLAACGWLEGGGAGDVEGSRSGQSGWVVVMVVVKEVG